jgi:hypothetical protein
MQSTSSSNPNPSHENNKTGLETAESEDKLMKEITNQLSETVGSDEDLQKDIEDNNSKQLPLSEKEEQDFLHDLSLDDLITHSTGIEMDFNPPDPTTTTTISNSTASNPIMQHLNQQFSSSSVIRHMRVHEDEEEIEMEMSEGVLHTDTNPTAMMNMDIDDNMNRNNTNNNNNNARSSSMQVKRHVPGGGDIRGLFGEGGGGGGLCESASRVCIIQ